MLPHLRKDCPGRVQAQAILPTSDRRSTTARSLPSARQASSSTTRPTRDRRTLRCRSCLKYTSSGERYARWLVPVCRARRQPARGPRADSRPSAEIGICDRAARSFELLRCSGETSSDPLGGGTILAAADGSDNPPVWHESRKRFLRPFVNRQIGQSAMSSRLKCWPAGDGASS